MQDTVSFLRPWLDRRVPMPSYIEIGKQSASEELGGFVSLERAVSLHESVSLSAESLQSSWDSIDSYIREAMRVVGPGRGWRLSAQESELILGKLGPPPAACLPIYIVSVGEGAVERVVYVGKTSARSGRFKGGHAAFTKLHHPDYDGMRKTLYLAAVVLLSPDCDYLPLEWVRPQKTALALLADIEAQLIYQFKPALNTHHVRRQNSSWSTSLHLQNFTGKTNFLNDAFCWPVA